MPQMTRTHTRRLNVAPPRGERGLKSCGLHSPMRPASGRSPSWGAWIEITAAASFIRSSTGRSPSWGAWIEILVSGSYLDFLPSRSPSWGAWIEIIMLSHSGSSPVGRSPSWGAWIEMQMNAKRCAWRWVAPPRGERGLKCNDACRCAAVHMSLPLVGSVD